MLFELINSQKYFPCVSKTFPVLQQNSLCFPCLEKLRTKFPVFPVPWPPCCLFKFVAAIDNVMFLHVCVCSQGALPCVKSMVKFLVNSGGRWVPLSHVRGGGGVVGVPSDRTEGYPSSGLAMPVAVTQDFFVSMCSLSPSEFPSFH